MLTLIDVDNTGASYYGEQGLHFVSIDGESCAVPLGMFNNVQVCCPVNFDLMVLICS